MKFTESEKNQEELELKFTRYIKLADSIKEESKRMKNDNSKRKRIMK